MLLFELCQTMDFYLWILNWNGMECLWFNYAIPLRMYEMNDTKKIISKFECHLI